MYFHERGKSVKFGLGQPGSQSCLFGNDHLDAGRPQEPGERVRGHRPSHETTNLGKIAYFGHRDPSEFGPVGDDDDVRRLLDHRPRHHRLLKIIIHKTPERIDCTNRQYRIVGAEPADLIEAHRA